MKRYALLLALRPSRPWRSWPGPLRPGPTERILNFQSHIAIHPDSSLTVTEEITVQAAGNQIKRGIIREFPTTYRDRAGHTVKVGFKVDEVYRDGKKEPYHLKHVANGVKIFLGQPGRFPAARGLHLHHQVHHHPAVGLF